MVKIKIRKARPADAAKIRNVHVASIRGLCGGDYSRSQIKAWSAGRQPRHYRRAMEEEYMVVAMDQGRIIGFSSLAQDEVRAVYVHPRWARQGVGKALLDALERRARRRGLKSLHLHSSLTAIPFYESHGYKAIRRTRHTLSNGIKIPCLLMRKVIRRLLRSEPIGGDLSELLSDQCRIMHRSERS